MDVTAGETAPKRWLPPRRRSIDLEDLEEILTDRLSPPRDLTRFIAAMRAKPRPAPPPVPRKLQPAASREECAQCGIPGFKGCAHQAPFVPADPGLLKVLSC